MRKTSIAVAFAAAVTSFAVNAQEAPSVASANSATAPAAKTSPAARAANGMAAGRHATGFSDRGRIAISAAPETAKAKAATTKDKVAAATPTGRKSPMAQKASKRVSVAITEQGMIEFTPGEAGVDKATTASIAPLKPAKAATKGAAIAAKAVSGKGPYGAIIARYAATYGVPVSLAHAVIRIESNYRVNARGSAGEIGLMQIKPATARGLGYSGSAAGLFNPETNIRYGMKYLGMAHRLGGGSTCGTILKYNAGHGAKRMNPVSANYCAKVRRHMGA
ncbi:MAG: transglycosylase SLT domain-containing protein [Proteobacteria bacterium]|nr:transglycosylase SLT domain-containing protein [Pseudomonadota bacterium]